MEKAIEARLKAALNFPSPPGVAQKIIALAGDPDVKIATVADAVSRDPGLAAKILRIANSALYARRRRSENLRQALMVLGLNAATTLALGFSIAPMFQSKRTGGIDYRRCWRRALISAVASRALGEQSGLRRSEDLFLAGLMQDIAALALDRAQPKFYAEAAPNAPHDELCVYEKERLGTDHAQIGGWLLRHWRLPEFLCEAVALSHSPESADAVSETGRLARCVGLAGAMADQFLAQDPHAAIRDIAPRAESLLGLDAGRFDEVVVSIAQLLPEVEQLFETEILDAGVIQGLMDQARELLTLRSLESLSRMSALQEKTHELEARTQALENQNRHDPLTGVFNRGYLDCVLQAEFASALAGHWPMSVIMIDLDHFKRINDNYGHPAGDSVLRSTAGILAASARDKDFIARYGGEEFVIVLPGTDEDGGRALCSRILAKLRATAQVVGPHSIVVSASLGLAAHNSRQSFTCVEDLLAAADRAMYAAKSAGRDQFICYSRDSDPQREAAFANARAS